jgi:cytochrome c oxidase cbb3-type subunit 3/ubiquinol-cytochrome c reductase cytochrome c subunit
MIRRLPVIITVISTAALAGCDWMPGKPTKSEESVIPADVHSFNTLYMNNCSGCHGADGQYGGARPLNDPLYMALASDEYFISVTTDGVPHTLMPAFAISQGGNLTNIQIRDLLDGIRRAWPPKPDVPGVNPPPLQSSDKGNVDQ